MKTQVIVASLALAASFSAQADFCAELPSHAELSTALKSVVNTTSPEKMAA